MKSAREQLAAVWDGHEGEGIDIVSKRSLKGDRPFSRFLRSDTGTGIGPGRLQDLQRKMRRIFQEKSSAAERVDTSQPKEQDQSNTTEGSASAITNSYEGSSFAHSKSESGTPFQEEGGTVASTVPIPPVEVRGTVKPI